MFFTLSLLVTTSKPCDIYKAAGTPCVAAHSTVRALSDSFHGPLYEIMSMKNGTTTLIHTLSPGGLADAAAQDAFCGAAACTISRILDQSGNANHLSTAPGGGAHGAADNGVNATALKIALGSHNVYGAPLRLQSSTRCRSMRQMAATQSSLRSQHLQRARAPANKYVAFRRFLPLFFVFLLFFYIN